MSAKTFYPKESGFTKNQVIEMIKERQLDVDEFKEINKPSLKKLTHELMQEFVDNWYKEMDDAFDAEYQNMGEIAMKQDEHLLALAKRIQDGS